MNIVAIIPARLNSSRFPGKPMKTIHGIPMIGHCYLRASMCKDLSDTYVATCDEIIYDYVISIGGKSIMTDISHERASDRAAEAMYKIEKMTNKKVDIVVMVQGDEPMVSPKMISDSLVPLKTNKNINIVNLMAEMETVKEFEDPNEVKVVVDTNSNAIYFSREAVPSQKKFSSEFPMLKQVCVIPFRRQYLLNFNAMTRTSLEIIESIDMLRIIENGEKIRMVMTAVNSLSVDTPYDLDRVRKVMLNDPLIKKYTDAKL